MNENALQPAIYISKLRSGGQFRTVYTQGQRFHSPYFSAFILPTNTGEARLGITVTRKVGKAVLRNLCKRRLREIFRNQPTDLFISSGYDLVINAKSELATANFSLVKDAFQQTLRRYQAFLQKRAQGFSAELNSNVDGKP